MNNVLRILFEKKYLILLKETWWRFLEIFSPQFLRVGIGIGIVIGVFVRRVHQQMASFSIGRSVLKITPSVGVSHESTKGLIAMPTVPAALLLRHQAKT